MRHQPADRLATLWRREPLAAAIIQGAGAVRAALAGGADANAIPWFGSPSLGIAVASGNLEIVRILIAHGANPRLKGLNGTSAIDEAAKIPPPGRERILRILATASGG
jgi:ankyrin repeat protein